MEEVEVGDVGVTEVATEATLDIVHMLVAVAGQYCLPLDQFCAYSEFRGRGRGF